MDIEKARAEFEDLLNRIAMAVQEFHERSGLYPSIDITGVDVTTHSSNKPEYRFEASGELAIRTRSTTAARARLIA